MHDQFLREIEDLLNSATAGSPVTRMSVYLPSIPPFRWVTEEVMPGVVIAESIWWNKHSPFGAGINQLVSDEENDMGGGPSFHGNLVEVEGKACNNEPS